jgi:hypothetical protein
VNGLCAHRVPEAFIQLVSAVDIDTHNHATNTASAAEGTRLIKTWDDETRSTKTRRESGIGKITWESAEIQSTIYTAGNGKLHNQHFLLQHPQTWVFFPVNCLSLYGSRAAYGPLVRPRVDPR